MTPSEIDALSGRELNVAVANALGCTSSVVSHPQWISYGPMIVALNDNALPPQEWRILPSYSTDPVSWQSVKQFAISKGWFPSIFYSYKSHDNEETTWGVYLYGDYDTAVAYDESEGRRGKGGVEMSVTFHVYVGPAIKVPLQYAEDVEEFTSTPEMEDMFFVPRDGNEELTDACFLIANKPEVADCVKRETTLSRHREEFTLVNPDVALIQDERLALQLVAEPYLTGVLFPYEFVWAVIPYWL